MSWRDVYGLVETSEGRILGAIGEVKVDVAAIKERVNSLETAQDYGAGRKAGRKDVIGVGRAAIAVVLSIVGAVAGVAAMLTR
jgi:hypothetical protein